MNKTKVLSAACALSAIFASSSAVATTIGVGLEYSWSSLPGQIPGAGPFYKDDSHVVHTSGIGEFSVGDLTDNVRQTGAPGTIPSPVVAQWGGFGLAPEVDIIFDLAGLYNVEEVVIGTHIVANLNNNAPSSLSVSYSTTGLSGFGVATPYDLEGDFGPLADGSHDLTVDVGSNAARYVKLTFGPGSMAEPGGSDPDEKWMLDEIAFNVTVPDGGTTALMLGLGLLGLAGVRRKLSRA